MIKANIVLDKKIWEKKLKKPNIYFKKKLNKLSKFSTFKNKKQEFTVMLTNNKKMKDLNKIFYDILLKINNSKINIKLNENLIIKYFPDLNDLNSNKYKLFNDYFINFYHFCFEISPETMIKDALNFKV